VPDPQIFEDLVAVIGDLRKNGGMENERVVPLYQSAVSAGFPSAGDDVIEGGIDLNRMLIKHPAATFFLRVSGHSMLRAGIHDGDVLVVDRSLKAMSGKVVIAAVNGELTVKRLLIEKGRVRLMAENDGYAPIEITAESELKIWGVVTTVIHSL
jgi:DNA polymerase V